MSVDSADDRIRAVLEQARVIAVVGASPDPSRDSHGVMAFLQSRGYRTRWLREFFEQRSWYRSDPTFSNDSLSADEQMAIRILTAFEEEVAE